MRSAYFVKILALSTLLAGCTVGPRYCPPELEVPCEWHNDKTPGMNTDSAEYFVWWEALNDPLLNKLIQEAGLQNLDLQIAATRILEARLERKGKEAALYPRLDASANYGHVYYNTDTLNDILGRKHKHSGHRHLNFFEIGFDAEWEIDLFGAAAHEINAAKARIEASENNFHLVWVTLSAEIGKNYIQLRGLQHRLDILKTNIASQRDTIHLTQELLRIGMGNSIDVRQAEEQLNRLEAQRSPLELEIRKIIHRLSVLLGYAPGDLYADLHLSNQLPALPVNKPIGVPSELLRRRPDIRKAERELAAATEQIGSAVAALFPRLSLRGFIGDISTHLRSLPSSSSFTWFAGPQLLAPIFNSRLLMQDVDYSKLKTREACLEYQKTVLSALEETENAIASFHHELRRNYSLYLAQTAAYETYQLLLELYQKGFRSYLDVLVANRSFLTAQDMYVQSQVDLLLHYIALYKSLGGGWDIASCITEDSSESIQD